MFADTRDIDGKAYGQMVLQLPENTETVRRMAQYVMSRGLSMEEVGPDWRNDASAAGSFHEPNAGEVSHV